MILRARGAGSASRPSRLPQHGLLFGDDNGGGADLEADEFRRSFSLATGLQHMRTVRRSERDRAAPASI